MRGSKQETERRALMRDIRACVSRFGAAVLADTGITVELRGDGNPVAAADRPSAGDDQYTALDGDPEIVHPGINILHGEIVIDGLAEIGSGSTLAPWVPIGLKSGDYRGPTLEEGAHVGTGAKILGPVRVGEGAQVGANAVVVDDVDSGAVGACVSARTV